MNPTNGRTGLYRLENMAPDRVQRTLPQTKGLVALVYTPSYCRFCLLENGNFSDAEQQIVEPGSAYEIRVFSSDWELRWRRQGELGAAALWTNEDPWGTQGWQLVCRPKFQRETSYLLWGEKQKQGRGWTTLAAGRIGTIDVPTEFQAERIAINAIEYFDKAEDGNVVYVGERINSFKPVIGG